MRGRDSGQLMPLAIGYLAIALSLLVVVTAVTDVYLTQRRLYALADSAALAASDSFELVLGPVPRVALDDARTRRAIESYLADIHAADAFEGLTLGEPTGSRDGIEVEVTLAAVARPPILSPFLPAGIPVTVTARARGGLRNR